MDLLQCKKCHVPQSQDAFGNDASRQTGKYPYCKRCVKDVNGANYVKHGDKIRAATKTYILNNSDKVAARKKAYREKTKEWLKNYLRQYHIDNRDSIRVVIRAYRKRHRYKVTEWARKRRAAIHHAAVIEQVSQSTIYKRDKGICQLCYKPVTKQDASLDHVIPLSKGGNHSYQNIVLTHKRCNSGKGNRSVTQQMRLFG